MYENLTLTLPNFHPDPRINTNLKPNILRYLKFKVGGI